MTISAVVGDVAGWLSTCAVKMGWRAKVSAGFMVILYPSDVVGFTCNTGLSSTVGYGAYICGIDAKCACDCEVYPRLWTYCLSFEER